MTPWNELFSFCARAALLCALLLHPCLGWGKGGVLWDQGVSLRFTSSGFQDAADPGSFVPKDGPEWLGPLPLYFSGLRVHGTEPRGSGVITSRSTQTAEGRFEGSGFKGRIKWTLGPTKIFCEVEIDWLRRMTVQLLGAKNAWSSQKVTATDRKWKLSFAVARPDRAPRSGDSMTAVEAQQQALASDPANLIEIDGPFVDQAAAASLAQLVGRSFQGAALGAPSMMGPFSTTRRKYEGRVFWDADVWMLPSLLVLNPGAAQRVAQFRSSRISGAESLAWSYSQLGFPRLDAKAQRRTRFQPPKIQAVEVDSKMARFPWESDRFGFEAGRNESMLQEHINGSVCLGLQMAADWGLAPKEKVERIKQKAAAWYLARSTKRHDGLLSIEGTLSPDESSIVDNDLYTNAVAEWLTGKPYGWPRDAKGLLTFEGDPVRGYKQHAALLTLFPLQAPRAEGEAQSLLTRFSGRASKDGPAMSLSLESLLWARAGHVERAHALWQQSWSKYCQTGVFTERPKGGEDVFVTGAAGCLNALIFGFAGMRLDSDEPRVSGWKKRLKSGAWLSFTPNLPPSWRKITFPSLKVDGETLRVEVTSSGVLVRPSKVSGPPQPQ